MKDIFSTNLLPNLDYCFRWSVHGPVDIHNHDNAELIYIASGSESHRIDGIQYNVTEGDLLIINPKVSHGDITVTSSHCEEYIIGLSNFNFSGYETDYIDTGDSPVLHTSHSFRTSYLRICNSIMYEKNAEMPGCDSINDMMSKALLIHLYRETTHTEKSYSDIANSSQSVSYLTRNIISFLNEHYSEHLTLDIIAHSVYLSPVYVSRIFKEDTGESLINHLISIRMEKAKNMLIPESNMSVHDVSAAVGYDDVYHFSKLFKKHFGISPLYYKKTDSTF